MFAALAVRVPGLIWVENKQRAVYCSPRTKDPGASVDVGELHNVFSVQTIKQLETDGAVCE